MWILRVMANQHDAKNKQAEVGLVRNVVLLLHEQPRTLQY